MSMDDIRTQILHRQARRLNGERLKREATERRMARVTELQLLRDDGLSLRAVGEQHGISAERARQHLLWGERMKRRPAREQT